MAARLPCLATSTPAPATTIAPIVEMLIVPDRSPPVPHVSTTGLGVLTGFANASIERAQPSISSTVSPFVRRAIKKPPIWPGVASPDMIACIAVAASSAERCWCETSFVSVCGQKFGSSSDMGRER